MSFVMGFFTKPVETVPVPHLPPFEHLEKLRQADRENKARYDAAHAKRIEYERCHRILDAVSIIKGTGFVRVAAEREHPEYAELWFAERASQQVWYVGRKAVSDLEFALGEKK